MEVKTEKHTCSFVTVWWQSGCQSVRSLYFSHIKGYASSVSQAEKALQNIIVTALNVYPSIIKLLKLRHNEEQKQQSGTHRNNYYHSVQYIIPLISPSPCCCARGDRRIGPSCLGSPASTNWPVFALSRPVKHSETSNQSVTRCFSFTTDVALTNVHTFWPLIMRPSKLWQWNVSIYALWDLPFCSEKLLSDITRITRHFTIFKNFLISQISHTNFLQLLARFATSCENGQNYKCHWTCSLMN